MFSYAPTACIVMLVLQEMQNAIGRTTHERDRVLADMERIEQVLHMQLQTLCIAPLCA